MEWSKIKNIILLILVAVNIFLLILVGYRQYQTYQLGKIAKEDMVQVLEKNGMTMDPDLLSQAEPFWDVQVIWDKKGEEQIINKVLGETTVEEQNDSKQYQGEKGTANIESNGKFSILFNETESMLEEEEKLRQIKKILQKMGLKTGEDWKKEETAEHTITYTTYQSVEGLNIFQCTIQATYQDNCLTSIEGNWIVGEIKKSRMQEETTLSSYTALMAVVQYEAEYGMQSKEVEMLGTGYQIPSVFTDEMQLEPVWYIKTDQNTYLINGKTGIVERIYET